MAEKETTTQAEVSSYTILNYEGDHLPDQYRALVFSKWLRSNRFGNDYMKLIDSDCYYKAYHNYIELLLRDPSMNIRLAVLSDAPDVVLGFCAFRQNCIDFVHIQKDFRKQGIGTALLPPFSNTFSHLTKMAMSIWASKYPNWTFNPFFQTIFNQGNK
jgi:GNAT superfamily N-acetyltransferase